MAFNTVFEGGWKIKVEFKMLSFQCSSRFTEQARGQEGGCQRGQPAGAGEGPNPPGCACTEDV